ncbi:PREDICTED: uncharacterized protein DDB_G0284459-like [Camelina sativa]|uniref:Uncharacterized protein DDB_G0284459-like n=1 Tax=Camelina sativa TaxID=90675 RepID=A0ABM0T7J0_CAMSA|nr:PREDICTED: uncharacterized protein DDB_G0284459-like [Camelina sativa]
MFGLEKSITVEHEILKENHETLVKDYECLQERIKHAEETYEALKLHLQKKGKELEESNRRLFDECVKERIEKEKVKKTFEEMKKTMEVERDAMVDELMTKNNELLLVKRKEEEELVEMENKYVELAEKFVVVEEECELLNSLYDAEVVAASVTHSAVVSEIGETDNVVGEGENEVNHNANNAGTDAMMINDESEAEHDKPPTPRESNISSHQSVGNNQEEQCRNRENSPKENRALGETSTPRSNINPPPSSPSSSSSSSTSSSSSSDGYEVVVKLPRNWPEWAIPKGPGNSSNKS